jgi:mitochondrial fission protein ELM1
VNSADRRSARPQLWLLLGHKAGDNTQVVALADALGWPREEKRIFYRGWELLSNRLLGVTLAGIDRARSSPLRAPWPDLVISSGRRNEPVARWIRRQSGNRTRIVHVGRPWAPLEAFDLIISTPQYGLPERPNVLVNDLPMHRLNAGLLAQAGRRWAGELQRFPGPRIAVLLGGNSGAFVFTAAKARRLGVLVNGLARASGGSVLATDSARTPPQAMDAFLSALDVPLHCHRWSGGRTDNPYLGYLALGDQFVVTAESMSMVAEAAFTAKPLFLFSLDDGPDWWRRPYNYRFKPLTHRLAMAIGPRRMRRNVDNILWRLVAARRAAWLGDQWCGGAGAEPPDAAMRAALAVAGLFVE